MKKIFSLTIAVLLIGGALGCWNCMSSAVTVRDNVEKTIKCGSNPTLDVSNVNGFLKISEGKAGVIHYKAEKVVKACDKKTADEFMAKLEVKYSSKDGKVSLETIYPKHRGSFFKTGFSSIAVNYTIEVPPGSTVDAETVNGAVTVNAPSVKIDCETTNGSITVHRAGLLSASTVNGKIIFTTSNLKKVETTNGAVRGTIDSLNPNAGQVETVNGSIKLELSPKSAVRVSAENVNGSISSDFEGAVKRKHHLVLELNGGGNTVSVETVNGSIKILQKS